MEYYYYYYYIPQPPFVLVGIGFFIALTCGLAFQSLLKAQAREIIQNGEDIRTQLKAVGFQLPLLGCATGTCIFLASGLEIFFVPTWFAYAISLPLTIATAGLIWQQLNKVMNLLREGGSEALDLDSPF